MSPADHVVIRRARTSDVPRIKELIDQYAGKILLEKNLVTLYESVQEFWVADVDGLVVGCGALHVLWADLGEVRGQQTRIYADYLVVRVGHSLVTLTQTSTDASSDMATLERYAADIVSRLER